MVTQLFINLAKAIAAKGAVAAAVGGVAAVAAVGTPLVVHAVDSSTPAPSVSVPAANVLTHGRAAVANTPDAAQLAAAASAAAQQAAANQAAAAAQAAAAQAATQAAAVAQAGTHASTVAKAHASSSVVSSSGTRTSRTTHSTTRVTAPIHTVTTNTVPVQQAPAPDQSTPPDIIYTGPHTVLNGGQPIDCNTPLPRPGGGTFTLPPQTCVGYSG